MPRGDRTGPSGAGPKTGRGQGYCTGNDAPGFQNVPNGRGIRGSRVSGRGGRGGLGRGGLGFRNWFHATGLSRWARGIFSKKR